MINRSELTSLIGCDVKPFAESFGWSAYSYPNRWFCFQLNQDHHINSKMVKEMGEHQRTPFITLSMWWLFVCLRGRIGVDFARCLLTIWLALTMDSCPLPNDEEDWVLLLCDYVLVSRFTYISITVEHKRKTHLFSLLSSLIVLHTPVWKWMEKARGTSLSFHYDFVSSNNRCDNTLELKIKTVFG